MGKIAIFKFPNYDKEPTRCQVWISRVPREGWRPGNDANIYICEKQQPSHLTKVPIKPRRTLYSTSESRYVIQCERDEEIILEQSSRDKFGTIDELDEEIDKAKLPQDVVIIKSKEHIVFFKVSV